MKKVGALLFSFLFLSLSSPCVFAEDKQDDIDKTPPTCPSLQDVREVGVTKTMPFAWAGIPLYLAYHQGTFNTSPSRKWIFVFAVPRIEVSSQQETLDIASSELANVTGNPSPVWTVTKVKVKVKEKVIVDGKEVEVEKEKIEEDVRWLCMYTHPEYFVLALHPDTIPLTTSPQPKSVPVLDTAFYMQGRIPFKKH